MFRIPLPFESPTPPGALFERLTKGEEVTVKKLYRKGEMVRLKPENGEHEDVVLPAQDVRIQG